MAASIRNYKLIKSVTNDSTSWTGLVARSVGSKKLVAIFLFLFGNDKDRTPITI